MKSYLSLIPISAKVRKRQNRMTRLCIIISVLLVTTIFSVADMMIRKESTSMLENNGNWHVQLDQISQDIGKEISRRPDVKAIGWSEVFNQDADEPYSIDGKKAALIGTDEAYMTQLMNGLKEGKFPQSDEEVMLSTNAKEAIGAQLGDRITLHTPAGDTVFTVSGFGADDDKYYQGQTYLVGICMTRTSFSAIMGENEIAESPSCYVQFQDAAKAAKAISELTAQYHLSKDRISENTAVMGISGKSSSKVMKNIYGIAAVLFVLVLLAGVLMISGSMNSNVTQRTRFFGMLRCIGASRGQIIRFVRLEALNWCKTAVPVGVALGTAISWAVCALLHYGIGGEFATTPVFAFSPVGVISGIVVGITTVLLAAQSPAKHAARVSPVAAISGNTETERSVRRAVKSSFGKIEWNLGIHHAAASRKNWVLMTASFALSIILLLTFSVGMDLARELIPSLRSWQPDIILTGYANALVMDRALVDEIDKIPGVKHTFGSCYADNIPATSSRASIDHINLVSYDTYMMECAQKSVVQGDFSEISGDGSKVMTIYNKNNPFRVGDTIDVGGTELEVACALSEGLFADDLIIICPQEMFDRLMGEEKYGTIGVQLDKTATEETVEKISSFVTGDVIFSDTRKSNEENISTYWATRVVGYGFLIIIGMITVFNIINSISMSVSARTKQYGAMRAVGMDDSQLTRMITAETFTYAFSGLVVGCGIGIPLSRSLYVQLITRHFGKAWTLPTLLICIIVLFVLAAALAAVYVPAKRIRSMAVTDTINEL
ncbi:ABC transporter permease [Hespellia stercorisuis]|uniref:Putative ABC transport system permease protein n=1 Tax=Hespellia stercorisuis DSM 15480 TaxID=1121950 RepID=A0A1M6S4T8_9FIRM|nr:ABC transporter permease [Hespellia stercorisuis]SHK39689.1 putative ABC transport system permease protein [Hespellia stercorisuis DSM 15480]